MKKNPRRVAAGYRNKVNGKAAEILVAQACLVYKKNNVALIEKNPDSLQVIDVFDPKKSLFIARFTRKSKPDFEGVLSDGQAVLFDVKATESDRIRSSSLSDNQSENLRQYHKMGALCFILVCIRYETFYSVPWTVWNNMKEIYGHLHMTHNELQQYRVSTDDGYVHFLDVFERGGEG